MPALSHSGAKGNAPGPSCQRADRGHRAHGSGTAPVSTTVAHPLTEAGKQEVARFWRGWRDLADVYEGTDITSGGVLQYPAPYYIPLRAPLQGDAILPVMVPGHGHQDTHGLRAAAQGPLSGYTGQLGVLALRAADTAMCADLGPALLSVRCAILGPAAITALLPLLAADVLVDWLRARNEYIYCRLHAETPWRQMGASSLGSPPCAPLSPPRPVRCTYAGGNGS